MYRADRSGKVCEMRFCFGAVKRESVKAYQIHQGVSTTNFGIIIAQLYRNDFASLLAFLLSKAVGT